MECNKEEAIRAKEIAENKMQSNDFAVARKFALKAQRLYQDLENVSQMITVCDVHCSAEKKLFGNEMDWYGLLQIEQTANEATIKKQYRKFALQLHPDKNKFPGAETAFKLIGDAHRVLLDKDKRSLHDMKCKASVRRPTAPYQPPQKPTYPNVGTQNDFRSTFTGSNFHHQRPQQPAQPGISNGGPTFWTMCPFCTVKYQYYRKVINKYILCQTCNKPFVAYERGEQSIPMATNLAQPAFHQQKVVVPSQPACKFEQVFKGNFAPDNSKATCPQKTRCSSDFGKEKVNGKRGRKQVVESSESCSSESSSDSEVDVAIDENSDIQGGENFGHNADQNPRRSRRHKKQVFYKENLSDDNDDNDFMSHPKRFKGRGSSCATGKENGDASREEVPKFDRQSGSAAAVKEEQIEAKQKYSSHFGESLSNVKNDAEKASGEKKVEENGCENRSGVHADGDKTSSEAIADSTLDSSSETAENPEFYVYPDPDFNDFDKCRKEECFKVGQMWAIYDTVDAMPRFYALIRNIFTSAFKVRITWLEPDPDDVKAKQWVNKGLPFSCGRFMRGNSDITEDRLMFSHLVGYEIGIRGDTYNIYPMMGEVWGLFKSWDFNWISDADRKYDYEFVEILSEYTKGVGITVAYLAKVKGFASVFYRKSREGTELVQIPPAELFRFSHSVPSFKLTGEEREDVLKGSFELDPASLPLNLEEISVPEILKNEAGGVHSYCSLGSFDREKSQFGSEGCTSMHQDKVKETCLEPEGDRSYEDIEHQCVPPASTPEAIEIPDPELFNDFDKGRKEECFKVGQMWAIYDTVNAMPRFYALIRNVFTSGFKLRITWLEPDPDDVKAKKWVNKGLPFSCGRFMHGNSDITEDRLMFSHLVCYDIGIHRDTYNIYPRMGEVWGLFKSWDFNWISDANTNRKYDYEFVEILSDYTKSVGITVAYLAKVKGFASVFYRKSREGTELVQIPPSELFRFSHSVPSFKLTGEERDDVLKGSFELDPASLPLNLEEISVPEILKNEAGGVHSNCSLGSFDKEKSRVGSEGCTSMHPDKVKETCLEPEGDRSYEDIEHQCAPPASTPEAIEIPDPEFFNFAAERSENKLQVGQIWSLYSVEDGLPKRYGQIVKIQPDPEFKLYLRWLESCLLPNNTIWWHDEGMPICCGRFKIKKGKLEEYPNTVSFSHLVSAEPASNKNEFTILPRYGEIWALYKNWDAGMKSSNLENCEYDIVEIIEAHNLHIEVLLLKLVAGFNSVFKPRKEASAVMKISLEEMLRFSHQIPAFKLTEERDSSLRGCWELDPAALPVQFFLLHAK